MVIEETERRKMQRRSFASIAHSYFLVICVFAAFLILLGIVVVIERFVLGLA